MSAHVTPLPPESPPPSATPQLSSQVPATTQPVTSPAPLGRRWLQRADEVAEWAIVLLMVIAAVASAVSYDNATRFADTAEDLANEALFAASLEGQRASRANTAVVHDQRVALGCVAAGAGRDAAIAAYTQRFNPADLALVAADEQRRTALRSLLLDPQGCAEYDAEAGVVALGGLPDYDSPDWRAILVAAEDAAAAVPYAVGAAVLMAVVLLLLTLADLSRRPRWVWTWLGLAIVVAGAGAVLAAAAIIASGGDAGGVLPVLAAMAVVLALFLVLTRRIGAAVRRGAAVAAEAEAAAVDPAPSRNRRLAWMPRHGTWWAEVLGAITLVAFAVAVLALSSSSSRQQDAVLEADRYALEARQALEFGEQAALGVLAYVEELSLAGDTPVAEEVLARWDRETRTWQARLERLRDSVADPQGAAADPDLPARVATAPAGTSWHTCLAAPEILPWLHPDESRDVALPAALADRQRQDPRALGLLVERSTAGATRCSTQAAMSRLEAAHWGAAASAYTVALLVLGLAGFLFALASDEGRSAWPRRWLMGSAVVGIAAGIGLTAATWLGSPRAADQDAIDAGASALARARVEFAAFDCADARDDATIAVESLPGLSSAQDLLADTIGCQPDGNWLISPYLGPADVEAFIAAHESARALGATGPATSLSLGWGTLLRAIGLPEGGERTEALTAADRLHREALVDPRLSPYACFNVALGTLAAGDEEAALAQYGDTLAAIAGDAADGAWCPEDPELTPVGGDLATLSALADLELLDPARTARAKTLLVLGDGAVPTASAAPAAVEGLTITTGPQRMGTLAAEGSPLATAEDVAIVWYVRADATRPWAVLTGPSSATMRPGQHVGWDWLLGRPAPAGELRIDVYAGGGFAGTVTTTDDWWASRGLDASAWRHVQLTDLGLSVVLPAAWEERSSVPGVETRFGAGENEVAFRRVEGASGDDVAGTLRTWSGRELAPEQEFAGGWYVGLEHGVYGQPDEATWVGAAYQQYLGAPGEGALVTDVTHESCPGTMIMTSLEAADPAVLETVWRSQELTDAPPTVPADAVPVVSPFTSPAYSVAFPETWAAVGCPRYFMAAAPGATSNVVVTSEPWDGGLDEFTDLVTEAYATDFEGYVLESDEPAELSNGLPARRVTFTWTTDEVDIRQEQTFAVAEQTAFVLTVTEVIGAEVPAADLALIRDSFMPTVGERIPVECDGCDPGVIAVRQRSLEAIAGRLAMVDRDQCRDATDEYVDVNGDPLPGLEALVRCRFPSGFDADIAAWEDRDAFEAFVARYLPIADATVRDWWLTGDTEAPRTGVTVEWVEDGMARFFWSYEADLLTAHARLDEPDQERLNQWWQTNGALRR